MRILLTAESSILDVGLAFRYASLYQINGKQSPAFSNIGRPYDFYTVHKIRELEHLVFGNYGLLDFQEAATGGVL